MEAGVCCHGDVDVWLLMCVGCVTVVTVRVMMFVVCHGCHGDNKGCRVFTATGESVVTEMAVADSNGTS